MLKAVLPVLVVALAGCGGGSGVTGTYHATTGLQEIVLAPDGTFRMMYGERTSPSDRIGTYRIVGDTVVFSAKEGDATAGAPMPPAKLTEGGLELGSQTYKKT